MVVHSSNWVAGDVAFAVTRQGVIALWNHAAEKVVGYSASAAFGQYCWKLLRGQDIYGNPYCSKHCKIREMAFQGESVNAYQASFKTGSEDRKCFSINCLLVLSSSSDDLLLHICETQNEDIQPGNGHTRSCIDQKSDTLTRREIEVLSFLKAGKSTVQIASNLCISTSTVRNHIQHVLNKLKVHSRLEAIIVGKSLVNN